MDSPLIELDDDDKLKLDELDRLDAELTLELRDEIDDSELGDSD